jgi:tetratricopeptide (TPR) repeat protein
VAEICHRLDGLPLAIELAAARVRMLPPQVLLTRLGSRLNLLTRRTGDSGSRHRTLRDTIAWSYDLLAVGQQQLFRRAAVLRGPSTLEAVAAVADEEDVEPGVQALVDQSLLRIDRNSPDGATRISMLETIREFALEQLHVSGEDALTLEVHARYFAGWIEFMEPEMASPQPGASLTRMRIEAGNIRAALDWYAERGTDPGELAILIRMMSYWSKAGNFREARDRMASALHRHQSADPTTRARALHLLGWLSASLGDSERAIDLFLQALDLRSSQEDTLADDADSHYQLGLLAERAGAFDEATNRYERALAIFGALSDSAGMTRMMHDLGRLGIYQGRYQDALERLHQCIGFYRREADIRGLAIALLDTGAGEMLSGDYPNAWRHLEESLALFRLLKEDVAVAIVSTNLGRVLQLSGAYDAAQTQLGEALALTREVGVRGDEALALYALGRIMHYKGDYCQAEIMFFESLCVAYEFSELWLASEALEGIAGLNVSRGQWDQAARFAGGAAALRSSAGSQKPMAELDEYEESLRLARNAIGDAAFNNSFSRGQEQGVSALIAELSDQMSVTWPQPQEPA